MRMSKRKRKRTRKEKRKMNFQKKIIRKKIPFKWEEILDYYFEIIIITKKRNNNQNLTWSAPLFSNPPPILLFLSFQWARLILRSPSTLDFIRKRSSFAITTWMIETTTTKITNQTILNREIITTTTTTTTTPTRTIILKIDTRRHILNVYHTPPESQKDNNNWVTKSRWNENKQFHDKTKEDIVQIEILSLEIQKGCMSDRLSKSVIDFVSKEGTEIPHITKTCSSFFQNKKNELILKVKRKCDMFLISSTITPSPFFFSK